MAVMLATKYSLFRRGLLTQSWDQRDPRTVCWLFLMTAVTMQLDCYTGHQITPFGSSLSHQEHQECKRDRCKAMHRDVENSENNSMLFCLNMSTTTPHQSNETLLNKAKPLNQ